MEITAQNVWMTKHRSRQSEEPKEEIQSASSWVTVDLGERRKINNIMTFSHTQLTFDGW